MKENSFKIERSPGQDDFSYQELGEIEKDEKEDIDEFMRKRNALLLNRGIRREARSRILDFHDFIKSKYPEHLECYLLQRLVGSTPPEKKYFFDFHGKDSVKNYVEELLDEYKKDNAL